MTDYAKGFLITLAGVLVLTPDTLLVRLVREEPSGATFLGGALVIGALAVNNALVLGRGRRSSVR